MSPAPVDAGDPQIQPSSPLATFVVRIAPTLAVCGGLTALAFVAVAIAQPIVAEDTWWHLAMGARYAAKGPWLDADPFLFTAARPPDPAAWLFGLGLHELVQIFGLQALRILNVLLGSGILAAVYGLFRKVGAPRLHAFLAMALFASLSAYRLFQLRPHLASMALAVLVVSWLVAPGDTPSWRRVALSTAAFALWVNLHGAFVVGLGLLGAAVGGAALGQLVEPSAAGRARVMRLSIAFVLAILATFVNPMGAAPHGLYFEAGQATPDLAVVLDDWSRFPLFSLPRPRIPPSPLAWATVWGLLVGIPVLLVSAWRRRREGPSSWPFDPALGAAAMAAIVAMLMTVRLLWLVFLPLAAILAFASQRRGARVNATGAPLRPDARMAAVVAMTGLLLAPAFTGLGDWPMVSGLITRRHYAEAFPAFKHDAHAVWFLRDAGLEGRLFNSYTQGNFLSYWLPPRLSLFVSGSLNVPPDVLEDLVAIEGRRGARPEETFEDLLDRRGFDVFLGTGLPLAQTSGRPAVVTTTHLEDTPGWVEVFRSVGSAVYVRSGAAGRENLERIARYYAERGVPFDPDEGFRVDRVIRTAPQWAVSNGLLPVDHRALEEASQSRDPSTRLPAQNRRASFVSLIGLYIVGAALDQGLLARRPDDLTAARRRVWSLLHAGLWEDARVAADELEQISTGSDPLSAAIVEVARHAGESPESRRTWIAALPVLGPQQLAIATTGLVDPVARPARPARDLLGMPGS